ncbi:MAG: hypothetical protein IJF67_06085 [Clostridia bacterium]|nr:hypothetical protein [Clostridia bacterium]
MNEKSRLRLLLAGSVGAAVVSAAFRILLTLTCFDAGYGVYTHDAVLPTVYHILLLILLAGLCVCGILFPPKREPDAPLPVSDSVVFLSILTGFMLAANALLSLLNIARGASPALLDILDIAFAVLSILFFLGLTRKQIKPAVLAITSIAPIGWCSVTLIRIYFDNTMMHSSPVKTFSELAMLAAMIALLAESRSHLGILPARFFAAASLAAPVLLITHAVPAMVLPGSLLTAGTDSYLHVIVETALALFIWARFAGILRPAPADADADAPEDSKENNEA